MKDPRLQTNLKHGLCNTVGYNAWSAMMDRCYNPKEHNYPNYGGRGIKGCERWHDVRTFVSDVGMRPSPRHTVDRINVNGDYEPGNFRWVTMHEQNRNKRNNLMLTYNGKTMCLVDWADRVGLNRPTMRRRLKAGWSLDEALTQPSRRATNVSGTR